MKETGPPEWYRAINPKMRVPALLLDGEEQVLTEVPAILTAINFMDRDKHLLGKTDIQVARAYEWLAWLSGTLHGQAFGQIIRPHRFSDNKDDFPRIKAKGLKTAEDCFDSIEQKLTGVHAVGDEFTVVDIFLLVFYRWAPGFGFDMQAKYPKYTKLVAEVMKRPAVQAAFKAEGLDTTLN